MYNEDESAIKEDNGFKLLAVKTLCQYRDRRKRVLTPRDATAETRTLNFVTYHGD